MTLRLILATALVLPLTGCAAGIQTGFEELHPAMAPVYAERIAVLPVTAIQGSESYREVIGDSLLRAAERFHPDVEFVGADEALERLNEAGLAERFATLLLAYTETGIYDSALLRKVGQALGVDHVLQLRVGYDRRSEVEAGLFDPGTLYEADRQNLYVNAVLWDVRNGVLAWEAAGSSTTRDAEYELPRSFLGRAGGDRGAARGADPAGACRRSGGGARDGRGRGDDGRVTFARHPTCRRARSRPSWTGPRSIFSFTTDRQRQDG